MDMKINEIELGQQTSPEAEVLARMHAHIYTHTHAHISTHAQHYYAAL